MQECESLNAYACLFNLHTTLYASCVPTSSCRAQFVLVMLVLFTLTLPLLMLAYVPNHPLAVVLTVATVATYWTVNEVARDVEDPFLYGT